MSKQNVCVPGCAESGDTANTSDPSTSRDQGQLRCGKDMEIHNLFKEIQLLKNELDKNRILTKKYISRIKQATKFSQNEVFIKATKNFKTATEVFKLLQCRNNKKKAKGRKFSHKEILLTLALYNQGPRAYKWLRKLFVLPAPVTLQKFVTKAGIKPGINEQLFGLLKRQVSDMKASHRLCVLLFDEMALQPHLDYNEWKDEITGFVDNGRERKNEIADHALVFMVRGAVKNYSQPIAYSFSSGRTTANELARQIKDVVKKLQDVGFKVIATVCDHGASNLRAIKNLINETKAKYESEGKEHSSDSFEIDGNEIVPLFDPPHLIKGVRNNLLKKNLKYEVDGQKKVAKWEHLVLLYKENPGFRGHSLLPLTEVHMEPNKLSKMKLEYATQVFSSTVTKYMGFLAEHGTLPEDCTETAHLLLIFDRLFDSTNGSPTRKNSLKPLLGPLTPISAHHKFWKQKKPVLRSMTFIDEKGIEKAVPSTLIWLRTIENLEYLLKKSYFQFHIKSIWLGRFNLDPLQNFFDIIRSHGARKINPTPFAFEFAYASLLINNSSSTHFRDADSEADSCKLLQALDISNEV